MGHSLSEKERLNYLLKYYKQLGDFRGVGDLGLELRSQAVLMRTATTERAHVPPALPHGLPPASCPLRLQNATQHNSATLRGDDASQPPPP